MVSREQCHGHAFNLVPYLQFVFKSKKLFQIKSFKKKNLCIPRGPHLCPQVWYLALAELINDQEDTMG